MTKRGFARLDPSAFAGFRFPPDVITLAVRWYLRFGLSYRDVEELLAERGIEVDHVSVYRWVQRFTPLFGRDGSNVSARWRRSMVRRRDLRQGSRPVAVYLYRAVDQFGQVIDVRLSDRRNLSAAREFFCSALAQTCHPVEVTTDRAAAYPRALEELLPAVHHVVAQYANNPVECDHGRLKSRLRPMRGLKRRRSAIVVAAGHAFVQNIRRGHAFVQNIRRGHYELALDVSPSQRVSVAFTELAVAL